MENSNGRLLRIRGYSFWLNIFPLGYDVDKKSTRRIMIVLAVLLLAAGAFLTAQGLQPYPIRDMNGDGVIDWRDYDVNRDGVVDMYDVVRVASAYGSTIGDERYDPRCDFNGDGVIDDFDVNVIKDYYGQGTLSLIDLWTYRATTPKGIQFIVGVVCLIAAVALAIKSSAIR